MLNKSKYKHVIQKKDYDCGVAASYALLVNSKVKNINYRKLARNLRLSRRGVSYKNIAAFFSGISDLKPKVRVYSSLEYLRSETKKGRLAIVAYQTWGKNHEIKNLKCGHYSVAVKVLRNKVYLLDPAAHRDWGDGVGWRVIAAKDFNRLWVDKDGGKIIRKWMLSVNPLKHRKDLRLAN